MITRLLGFGSVFCLTALMAQEAQPDLRRVPPKAPPCGCGMDSGQTNRQLRNGSWVEYQGRQLNAEWLSRPNTALRTTGLFLLAHLGDGSTLTTGQHKHKVALAHKWLVHRLDAKNGFKTRDEAGSFTDRTLATYALCEAARLSADAQLVQSLVERVRVLIKDLTRDRARAPAELLFWAQAIAQSMWKLDAVDSEAVKGAVVLLAEDRQRLTAIVHEHNKQVMIAEAKGAELKGADSKLKPVPLSQADRAFSLHIRLRKKLQGEPDVSPEMLKLVDAAIERMTIADAHDPMAVFVYSLTIYQVGGEHWQRWSELTKKLVVKTQQRDQGPEHGTWRAPSDSIGPMQTTAWNILTLECYYRYICLALID